MNPQLIQDHHWEGKTLIEQDIKDNWSQSWKLPDHPSHKAWGGSLNTGYKADGQVDIEAWRKVVGGGADPQLAEELGVEFFTDSQKKRMRSSYSQGAIPGYETDMASYGFDYEEYTKAMEDQEREKTWLEIVLKNPSHPALIQIFGSQAAVDQMIRETQRSIASRDAYYRDNWANWKASLAAEQEADLARWAELEEAYHYIEQGDFEDGQALLKYIGAQMDLLAYNINGRSHAIVQTAEDFAQFSGAAADYGSDWVYAAVNQKSGYFDDLTAQFHTPELSKYAFLTDEEQATYNYYYHFDQQMGTRCAAAYLSYIDNRLTYREAMYAAEDAERFGHQHPVAGTLASSLFTLVEGGGALLTGWNALMGSDYTNPYSRAYAPHIMKESLREGVTEDFSPTGKALYGIGTGLMDQGVAMLTGNAPMVMGLTDATGQSFDAGTQGGGTYEMAGEGLGAYAIGALTEQLDVGRFTQMLNLGKAGQGSFKELLTTFLKNGLAGGMEEIPQGYLTAALDRFIMAESSHWETRKIELTAQGLSPEEAEKQLWNELNYDALINGVTGFLTSGTLSVAGYGAGKASARKTVAALAPDDPKIKGSGILAKYQRDIISLDNLKAAYAEAEAAGSTPEQLARIEEKIQKQEAALEAQEASTELTRVLEADELGKDNYHGRFEGLSRKTKNIGEYAIFRERMSRKHIRQIATEYGIEVKGLQIIIDSDKEKMRKSFMIAGRADPGKIGRIDFFPKAFISKEELLRTLFHEKMHVDQYKEYGVEYVQNHREYFEKLTAEAEENYIKKLKEEGKLDMELEKNYVQQLEEEGII